MSIIESYLYAGKHRTPSNTAVKVATATVSASLLITPTVTAQELSHPIFYDEEIHAPKSLPKLTLEDDTAVTVIPTRESLYTGGSSKLSVRGSDVIESKVVDHKSAPSDEIPLNMFDSISQFQQRLAAEEEAQRPKAVSPAEGSFTSGFGARWGAFHSGIDIANSEGTAIVSVMDGVVLESGPASGYGNWIRIQHEDGSVAIYGHMSRLDVVAGEKVKAGQVIAGMGNLGYSTGSHLHLEIHINGTPVDPMAWLLERGAKV